MKENAQHTFADTLGHAEAAELLQETLEEERAMDAQLSQVAKEFISPKVRRIAWW